MDRENVRKEEISSVRLCPAEQMSSFCAKNLIFNLFEAHFYCITLTFCVSFYSHLQPCCITLISLIKSVFMGFSQGTYTKPHLIDAIKVVAWLKMWEESVYRKSRLCSKNDLSKKEQIFGKKSAHLFFKTLFDC